MKRSTRVLTGASVSCFAVGIALSTVGIVMGASVDPLFKTRDQEIYDKIERHSEDGEQELYDKIDRHSKDGWPKDEGGDDHGGDHDHGGFEHSSGGKYEFATEDVHKISLSILFGDVNFHTTNGNKITVDTNGKADFEFECSDGELEIETELFKKGTVDIGIPVGFDLHKIYIESAAGDVSIDGVGFHKCEIESAAGKVNINVPAKKEDYNLELYSAFGDIKVDGQDLGYDVENERENVDNEIYVGSAAGSIDVNFKAA